jgi:hypothetical protein
MSRLATQSQASAPPHPRCPSICVSEWSRHFPGLPEYGSRVIRLAVKMDAHGSFSGRGRNFYVRNRYENALLEPFLRDRVRHRASVP